MTTIEPDEKNCPYCGHGWGRHNQLFGDSPRCDCGCMWQKPKPPEPPPPPPTAEQLTHARVLEAIFDELDRQAEEDGIDAPYWDREWGRLDGEPDWGAVANAAITAVNDEKPPLSREIR